MFQIHLIKQKLQAAHTSAGDLANEGIEVVLQIWLGDYVDDGHFHMTEAFPLNYNCLTGT